MTRRSTAVAILVASGSSQAQSPTVTGLGSVWFDIDTCNAGSGPWTLSGEGCQAGATATTWGMRSGGTEPQNSAVRREYRQHQCVAVRTARRFRQCRPSDQRNLSGQVDTISSRSHLRTIKPHSAPSSP